MKRLVVAAAVVTLAVGMFAPSASAGDWSSSIPFTNVVASRSFRGGGYPVPPGQTAPDPGTCRLGTYNANRSESWVTVKPGSEDLVGLSKAFFEKYSTFYDFHLASYLMTGGSPGPNNIMQGYECVSTGTQEMPPSWTNNTDPNADFDTKGRVYSVTLPFNAFWANLHPNGAIDVSYSDDMGRHWVKGNGGNDLEQSPNASAKQAGHVEDKQWVAVNHIVGNAYQDHVYAAWTIYNGSTAKIRVAVSCMSRSSRQERSTSPVRLTTARRSDRSYRSRRLGSCQAAAYRTRPSATASQSTSSQARPTRATCTLPTRTGTGRSSTSSSPPRWTAASTGRRRSG